MIGDGFAVHFQVATRGIIGMPFFFFFFSDVLSFNFFVQGKSPPGVNC